MYNWLTGRQVVVTRPRRQAASLSDRLQALGAHVISFPTIAITPAKVGGTLDQAIGQFNHYDWVIFSSANAVEQFWQRWCMLRPSSLGIVLRGKIAAVGLKTAQALARHDLPVHLVPAEYRAGGILDEIGTVAGKRILLPCADIAPTTLEDGLRRQGAQVDRVDAYHTVLGQPDPDTYEALSLGVDAITFASSSSVRNFLALTEGIKYGDPLIACIGPVTAATARELGLHVDIVPQQYTTNDLVNALQNHRA